MRGGVRAGVVRAGRRLADDRLARQYPAVRFTGLAVVFHGWELVRCEEATGPAS